MLSTISGFGVAVVVRDEVVEELLCSKIRTLSARGVPKMQMDKKSTVENIS